MKKLFFIGFAGLLGLASCSDDTYVGDQSALLGQSGNDGAISFSAGNNVTTRATHTGADAATLLGRNFVVEGIKGNGDYAGTLNQTEVFDHYNVNWVANTANTTTSNTNDWEYVAQTKHALSASGQQTIKYWDYTAAQYDFVAFSYGSSSSTTLTAIEYANLGKALAADGSNAVYSISGTSANLVQAYIADLVTAYKNSGMSPAQPTYQNVITPKFRRLGSKIRLAMYETIPGYSVKDVKFYLEDGTANQTNASIYGATAAYVTSDATCTMYVYYPTVGSTKVSNTDYNKAHVVYTTSVTKGKDVLFGEMNYQTAAEGTERDASSVKYLGRSSATATYATGAGSNPTTEGANPAYYIDVLPYEAGQALTLKVDYTLVPIDGAEETIKVTGASAVVPQQYTGWKSNYAYTYLFKISQNTNGSTGTPGSDPSGLYPITFDACVLETTDNIQETVTTVADPSITTYAKGVNPTTGVEYPTGVNIYVSLQDPGTATLTTTNTKLFTATIGAGAAQTLNEDAIANALVNGALVVADGDVTTIACKTSPSSGEIAVGTDVSSYYKKNTAGNYVKCGAGETSIADVNYYTFDLSKVTAYVVTDANGKKLTVTVASGLSIATEIAAADAPDGNAIAGNFAKFTPSAAGNYVFEYTDGSSKKHYKMIIVH